MEIIIKPVLTEKMTIQGEKLNRYGFIVEDVYKRQRIYHALSLRLVRALLRKSRPWRRTPTKRYRLPMTSKVNSKPAAVC